MPLEVNRDEVVKEITTLYTENKSSAYRINNEKEWQRCQELYLSIVPHKSFPWENCSNVDLGIVEMTVDNIKSRYVMSTISETPFFNTVPRTPRGEDNQKMVEDLMSYVLDQQIQIGTVLDELAHNTTKFGTAFTKRYWKKEYRETNRMQYKPALPGILSLIKPAGIQVIAENAINEKGGVDVVDLQHLFFPEDAGANIQNCHYIFHRIFLSPSELKQRVQTHGYETEGVEKCLAHFRTDLEARQKTAAQTVTTAPTGVGKGVSVPAKLSQDKLEVLECYIKYDANKDLIDEECVFTIVPDANAYLRGVALKDIYFDGLRPFNRFVYKDVGLLYGRGIPKMLENYRDAMNTIFNQGVDSAMMQIIPWFFYRYASSFKPEEVKLCPGKGVPVDNTDDVVVPTFPATAGLAFNVISALMAFVERQTGLSSPQTGVTSGERTTAYEISTVVSEGNIKHQDRIIAFHRELGNALEGIYHLYRQMLPQGFKMRIPVEPPMPQQMPMMMPGMPPMPMAGGQPGMPGQVPGMPPQMGQMPGGFPGGLPGVPGQPQTPPQPAWREQPVDRKDLLEEYDFVILGSLTMGNRLAKKQDAVTLYRLLMSNPYINQNPKAVYELLRDILSNFDKRNPDKFLPPEQVIDILYKQNLQKMMMGGLGGQPPRPTKPGDQAKPKPGGAPPTPRGPQPNEGLNPI